MVRSLSLLLALTATARAGEVHGLVLLGDDFTSLRSVALGAPGSGSFAWSTDVATSPLALRTGGSRRALVRALSTTRFAGSLAVHRNVTLGLSSSLGVAVIEGDVQAGPGELSVQARIGDPDVPLAILAELDRALPGAVHPFASHSLAGGVGLRGGAFGAQVLARVQPDDELDGTVVGSRLEGAFGVGGRVVPGVRGTLEVFGSTPMHLPKRSLDVPLELLASVERDTGSTRIRGALGLGLTDGLGTPAARFALQVRHGWEEPGDPDGDGLHGPRDLCPHRPEDTDGHHDRDGCPDPDNDGDGVLDADDACPDAPETPNGFRDDDGCPDAPARWTVEVVGPEQWTLHHADASFHGLGRDVWSWEGEAGHHGLHVVADGFRTGGADVELEEGADVHTLVVLERPHLGTLEVRVRDVDGVPLEALVFVEGVPHAVDGDALVMTQEVGAPLVRVVAPGHRAFETLADVLDGERTVVDAVLTPEAVVLEGNRLHTSGTPLFEVDRHTLADEEALDGLAAWLLAHPEVLLLRVEGHADPLGPSAYNYALSVRRAEGVAAGLVSRGVDAGRLQVVGAGEALAGEGPVRAVGFTVIVWAD